MFDLIIPIYINHPSLYAIVERCLSCIAESYPNTRLIIVDDASPLEHSFPVTIQHRRNQGFTKSVNDGLALSHAAVMVVMNDDIFIEPHQLDRFSNLKGAVIASPADTASSPDDRFGSIWGITREAYTILGPLDETYRHFYSDREYYDRAIKENVDIVKWPDIVVAHMESATYHTVDKQALLEADTRKYEANHGR